MMKLMFLYFKINPPSIFGSGFRTTLAQHTTCAYAIRTNKATSSGDGVAAKHGGVSLRVMRQQLAPCRVEAVDLVQGQQVLKPGGVEVDMLLDLVRFRV